MALEATGDRGRARARQRPSDAAIHPYIAPAPRRSTAASTRSELALGEQVDRLLAAQLAVAPVDPDVGALGGIDVAQALEDVVSLQQAVFRPAPGAVGPRAPVLDLADLDAGDPRQLGVGQDAAPQVVDHAGVEARGRGCLGSLHDISIIHLDNVAGDTLKDILQATRPQLDWQGVGERK